MDINKLVFDEKGLIPAITVDVNTNEVLMQAFMNIEAVEKTIATGKVHYFSRSRNKLWLKGETSGHFQHVVDIVADCDYDSLLVRVKQDGVACHTGQYSCFHNPLYEKEYQPNINILQKNIDTIQTRSVSPIEGSYTNYLLDKGIEKICKKVGEESAETIIAAMKNDKVELANELADLYYHTLVLMKSADITFSDVLAVLEERHNSERKRNYKA